MGLGQPNIPGVLTFDVSSLSVLEAPAPAIYAPFEIIPIGSPFTLRVNFQIDGWLGRGMNNLQFGGQNVLEYNLRFFAESIGQGTEWNAPMKTIVCQTNTYSYGGPATDVIVPANTLTEGNYKLTCIVKMSPRNPGSSGFPFHVTGFVEGPMIEIYIP